MAQNVWFAKKIQEKSLKYKFTTTELCNGLTHFHRNNNSGSTAFQPEVAISWGGLTHHF